MGSAMILMLKLQLFLLSLLFFDILISLTSMTVAVLHLLVVSSRRLLPFFVVPLVASSTIGTVVVFVLDVPPMLVLVHCTWFIPA